MQVSSAIQSLHINFGGARTTCSMDESGAALTLQIPLLSGEVTKPLLKQCTIREHNGFIIGENNSRIAGIACMEIENSLEVPAFELYNSILKLIGARQIHRIWNYLPAINAEFARLENYRAFNIGRQRAFASAYGTHYSSRISPASAVGVDGSRFAVAFIAGSDALENVENPEQIPAYSYPSQHGPKSPSFTRGAHGTVDGIPTAYLSGTSSIKEHHSIGHSDLTTQYNTTIDNMRLVADRLGYPGALGNNTGINREFTCYLRDQDDLGDASRLFRAAIGDSAVSSTRFLRSDICRRELLLEIEGTFSRPG